MNIVLLGLAGSGKGTQSSLMSQKYDMMHISSGDLLREAAANDEEIKKQLTTGKLFLNEQIIKLIQDKISNEKRGIVFDGFPRTLTQAEALDEITQIDFVIELKLSDEESVKRLAARRQCKQCKAIFGAESPPREEGKCNRCGGELYQRDDDKPEAMKKRIAQYHDETEPLLEYYKPRNLVRSVDAGQSIEDVFKAICKVIETNEIS